MSGVSWDQTELQEQLRELALHDEELTPSATTERVVMDRWAERRRSRMSTTSPSLRSAWTTRTAWAAAAAGAVAAIWLLAVALPLDRTPSRGGTVGPAAIPAVASAPQDVPAAGPPDLALSGSPAETILPVPDPPQHSRTAAAAPVTLDNEPFVRLLPLMDEELGALRIARVRLRGPAAAVLGLDGRLPPMGPDEFVEADVLLGEDGLARAIRFTY